LRRRWVVRAGLTACVAFLRRACRIRSRANGAEPAFANAFGGRNCALPAAGALAKEAVISHALNFCRGGAKVLPTPP
jgi:hypothetical protein